MALKSNSCKERAVAQWRKLVSVCYVCMAVFSLTIGMSACRKSVELPSIKEGELAEVQFSALFPTLSQGVRSLSNDAQKLVADPRRINFSDLLIVFYNLDEQKNPLDVAYVFKKEVHYNGADLSGADAGPFSPSEDGVLSVEVSPIKVKAGDYKVLLVFSPNEEFIERSAVGQPFSRMKEPFSTGISTTSDPKEGKVSYGVYTAYQYTNAANLTHLTLESFKGSQRLRLSAQVEPNHAYVSVSYNSTNVPTDHAVAESEMGLFRDVVNRKFYLFPTGSTIQLSDGSQVYYPEDPNFAGLEGKSRAELQNEFFYLSDIPNGAQSKFKGLGSEKKTYQAYPFPENTLSGSPLSGKWVSRVILRIAYTPDKEHIPLGKSWINVQGEAYEKADFAQRAVAIQGKNSASLTPSEKRLLAAYTQLKGLYGDFLMDPLFGHSSEGLQCYVDGFSYYAVPIRHLSDTQLPTQYSTGRFGVVRNTFYMINITKFSGPGYGDPRKIPVDLDYEKDDKPLHPGITFGTPSIVKQDVEL